MKIDEASKLMEYLLALSEPLNNATELTKSINDPEGAKEVRRRLAGIMSSVYEAMLPIIREYPELDPDK